MYTRKYNYILSNSFFLFGARGVGKSSLLAEIFKNHTNCRKIDLLDANQAKRFLLNPKLLETETAFGLEEGAWIIIDEIQKVPALLDYVHRLIESKKINFALTGSSARKLKRVEANMLAGRAFVNHLYPLTHSELAQDFNLNDVLHFGSLPKIFQFKTRFEKEEFLLTYANTYLKEEIKEEQIVRGIEPFLRFLEVAAQCNGEIINFSKISRDSGCDQKSVSRFYEILSDTLIGFFLEPFHRSIRKRQTQKSKFYFFDLGVVRALNNTVSLSIAPHSSQYGKAFEHFFILECIRLNECCKKRYKFSYLRTKDDLEIDLIIERPGQPLVLIEIKSNDTVDEVPVRRLRDAFDDLAPCELWVVSQVEQSRQGDFYQVLNWKTALEKLF